LETIPHIRASDLYVETTVGVHGVYDVFHCPARRVKWVPSMSGIKGLYFSVIENEPRVEPHNMTELMVPIVECDSSVRSLVAGVYWILGKGIAPIDMDPLSIRQGDEVIVAWCQKAIEYYAIIPIRFEAGLYGMSVDKGETLWDCKFALPIEAEETRCLRCQREMLSCSPGNLYTESGWYCSMCSFLIIRDGLGQQ